MIIIAAMNWGRRTLERTFAVVIVSVNLAFPQSEPKKAIPPPAKADTWQKSKECAAQAEKVMAERTRALTISGSRDIEWSNHYSPKYNRCFLKIEWMQDDKVAVKGGPMFYMFLLDAFERTTLANSADGPPVEAVCRYDDNPKECEQRAAFVWKLACQIEDQKSDCSNAREFIADHMKN